MFKRNIETGGSIQVTHHMKADRNGGAPPGGSKVTHHMKTDHNSLKPDRNGGGPPGG